MKKLTLLLSSVLVLSGCVGTTAQIKVPDSLQGAEKQTLTTEGDFWGLGKRGTFDFGTDYNGRYDREASGSSWFGGFIDTNKGAMAAEITNKQSQQSWQLACKGGGTSLNVGILSFGGDNTYSCDIFQDEQKQGQFVLKPDSSLISMGPTQKVSGNLKFNSLNYSIKSVHLAQGSFIPLDEPLGYSISRAGREIAIIQTNGAISLQHQPVNSQQQKDALAIATVASALSWRPKN